jgi:hypothetical protein
MLTPQPDPILPHYEACTHLALDPLPVGHSGPLPFGEVIEGLCYDCHTDQIAGIERFTKGHYESMERGEKMRLVAAREEFWKRDFDRRQYDECRRIEGEVKKWVEKHREEKKRFTRDWEGRWGLKWEGRR